MDGLSTTEQQIVVYVTNVDDVAPVITSPASFSASENQLIVGQVSATDDSESISFSILGANLEIDSDDGFIFSNIEAPDYEIKSTYTAVNSI